MKNERDFGIVLIHKERGASSFAMVARLRKLLGMKKIGHCGTLDPFAEGLLPMTLGRACAAVRYMEGYDKRYQVTAVLGERRDSLDCMGSCSASVSPAWLWKAFETGQLDTAVPTVAASLEGVLQQLPPMYAAIKVDGKPLYRYAREGKTIERKRRKVHVKILQHSKIYREEDQEGARLCIDFDLHCSKGTYVRSWIDDFGEALGTLAYCERLTRSHCGPFALSDAVTTAALFDRFDALGRDPLRMRAQMKANLFPLVTAFPGQPRCVLDESQARALCFGQEIVLSEADAVLAASETTAIPGLCLGMYLGEVLAFLRPSKTGKQGQWRAERVLASQAIFGDS